MIGTNTMKLNQATMRQTIQEWLDRRFSEGVSPGPRVTNVWGENGAGSGDFGVTLEGRSNVTNQT